MICSMIINLIQLERKLMALTKIEMQQLTDEFIHFQINQMTREEMASYVENSMRQEIICQRTHLPLNESLKLQIDEYDENLYDCLLYTSPSTRDSCASRMPSSA